MKRMLLAFAALFCLSLPVHAQQANLDLTEATCCGALSMPDTEGVRRDLSEFSGKVVAVTFGYMGCPDICPTTLMELAQSMELLQDENENVQVVFVTFDPEHDTKTMLSEYVSAFNPSFIALRGSLEETKKATRDFRILYRKVPSTEADSYTIDHSVGVYLIDKTGKPRVYAPSASPDTLLPEIKRLLAMES